MGFPYKLLRRIFFKMDPEKAHTLTIWALAHGMGTTFMHHVVGGRADFPRRVFGLTFPNPLGMAAGFDKNGVCVEALWNLGFGAVEVGTVTPRPQVGNPRPRVFRLVEDGALINRLGFNNDGHEAVLRNLLSLEGRSRGIVGVNIGPNKDSEDFVQDYVKGIRMFEDVADYITINVSSPNTEGLRIWQERDHLERLLDSVKGVCTKKTPIVLKMAPDLTEDVLYNFLDQALLHEIDGLIVSNTTVQRPRLQSSLTHETGGLSGKPLLELSTKLLRTCCQYVGERISCIGVGGIFCAQDMHEKFRAGAKLIQLYTGLIFEGPALLTELRKALA